MKKTESLRGRQQTPGYRKHAKQVVRRNWLRKVAQLGTAAFLALVVVGCHTTVPFGADKSLYATDASGTDQQLVNTYWFQNYDRAHAQPDEWLVEEMLERGLLYYDPLVHLPRLTKLPTADTYRGGRTFYVGGRSVNVSSNSASIINPR